MRNSIIPGFPAAWPRRAAVLACLGVIAVAGCSGKMQRAATVNAPRAREALTTALESWKKGEKPARLKAASPPIVVQDMDWESGCVLVDYQVASEGKFDDANLRIPVKLRIKDARGKELKKEVSYVVGTSPSVTVFRELF